VRGLIAPGDPVGSREHESMSNSPEVLRRAPSFRAFDHGDVTTVLRRDGTALEFRGDSARLVREMLRVLRVPQTAESLRAHFMSITGAAPAASGAIGEALHLLREAGAVATSGTMPHPTAAGRSNGRLVLGVTGAVAAAHTPALVERLVRRGFEIRVAMTKAAQRFVRPEPLRALTHHRVYRGLWSAPARAPAPHIDLAEWAEVVLVAPATGTTVSRLAQGDFSDVVSATALSTHAPVVVAPSMNLAMHDAPAVSRNLAQLVDDGFYVLHPGSGIEVADAPAVRRPIFGSWPAADDLVSTVEFIWQRARQRTESTLAAADAAGVWESTYKDKPAAELSFHSETIDADLREVLTGVKRPASLWDVGTGLGTTAVEASKLGFTVVGTDVSPRAIELASARSNGAGIRFMVDDVRRSKLTESFDVVVDRGCFHTLDASSAQAYVDALRRRTKAGSIVALKVHRETEPREWHTVRYRLPDLESLLGPDFELLRWSASTMPGNQPPEALAWLAVFRRRSA
jgi:SAM-dependent methyltransferase